MNSGWFQHITAGEGCPRPGMTSARVTKTVGTLLLIFNQDLAVRTHNTLDIMTDNDRNIHTP